MNNKNITNAKIKQELKILTWKKFIKYKIIELGVIPLGLLSLWKLPYWTGLGIIKLFGIDVLNNYFLCERDIFDNCIGQINEYGVWFLGSLVNIIIIIFIYLNYKFAKEYAEKEIKTKYRIKKHETKKTASI